MKREQLKQILEKSEFIKKLHEVISIFEEAEELDVLDKDLNSEKDEDKEKTSLSEEQIKDLIKDMDEEDRKTVEKAIDILKKASEKLQDKRGKDEKPEDKKEDEKPEDKKEDEKPEDKKEE